MILQWSFREHEGLVSVFTVAARRANGSNSYSQMQALLAGRNRKYPMPRWQAWWVMMKHELRLEEYNGWGDVLASSFKCILPQTSRKQEPKILTKKVDPDFDFARLPFDRAGCQVRSS